MTQPLSRPHVTTSDPVRPRKPHPLALAFVAKSFLILAVSALLAAPARAADFFIKDNDRVVFLGDSITEYRMFTNYIEAYALTRYPKWTLMFRNAGISGDVAGIGLSRIQRDVLPLHPTVVVVDYGMNDCGYMPNVGFSQARYDDYVKNQTALTQQLQKSGLRVVQLTTQPIEELPSVKDRALPDQDVRNLALRKFADGLKAVAHQCGVPFVDQFDPYMGILVKARAADPLAFIGGCDAIHPGPPGNIIMAWAILKGLGATPLVSTASIDAAGVRVQAVEGCQVTNLQVASGVLSFDRLDVALPMPIDRRAEVALKLAPIIDDLDRYELKVEGLKADSYQLSIDGEAAGTVTNAALAKGWNMALTKGPIDKQAQDLLQLVFKKNDVYASRWQRGQVDPQRQAELPKLDEEIATLETQINATREPKPHHFELKPVAVP